MVNIKKLILFGNSPYLKVVADVGVRGDLKRYAHYVRKENWESLTKTSPMSDLQLMWHSDVVIDVETNRFVKCRFELQEILEDNVLQL